jgi:hypothetical protein
VIGLPTPMSLLPITTTNLETRGTFSIGSLTPHVSCTAEESAPPGDESARKGSLVEFEKYGYRLLDKFILHTYQVTSCLSI